jgi:hypothetical protein
MIKNMIGHLSLRFCLRNGLQKSIAEETASERSQVLKGKDLSPYQAPQLEIWIIVLHDENVVPGLLGNQPGIPCEEGASLLMRHLRELMWIFSSVINRVVAQCPQALSQFTKHPIHQECHEKKVPKVN